MAAGVGRLASSQNEANALAFINYLLAESAQEYFAAETFEYPLASGVSPSVELTPLSELNAIEIELTNLANIHGTVEVLEDSGILP